MKDITQKYSKIKSITRKNILSQLELELSTLEILNEDTATIDYLKHKISEFTNTEQKVHKLDLKLNGQKKAEKNTKYFLGIEKSRQNSKVIDQLQDSE